MLYNTNYTQQVIKDAKKIATIKKLDNPLFIDNLKIKKTHSAIHTISLMTSQRLIGLLILRVLLLQLSLRKRI